MGIEMMMAFLEAYRFLKPCFLVDRDIHITNARYEAAQGPGSPESEYDVFNRVIAFERDLILARNIRRIHQTSVEYAPAGLNGPLVLATLGKAHIPGVAHHLTLPFSELDRIIAETNAEVV